MKKKYVIALIAICLLGGAGAFAYYKMKGGGKRATKQTQFRHGESAYKDIKVESTTMPAIFMELYKKSNPFTLHSRNEEMVAILEKEYAKDPTNLDIKWWL
ncbi:MAG TPA: hypothetical protein PL045_13280, partial [Chitinophagaceae bacterium]|nr:hypothetical protein [Chitinophagaceae bacterium]